MTLKNISLATLSFAYLLLAGCSGAQSADTDSSLFVALKSSVIAKTNIYITKATPWINCRDQAGTSSPVVFELKPGSVVDVVSKTTKSANGYLWLEVNPRGDVDHNTCWLAADDRFLTPANHIDRPLLPVDAIYSAKVFGVIGNVACRENPNASSPVIFDLRPGIVLDVVESEFGPAWNGLSYWVQVNPRGDIDHNICWVPGLKAALQPL